MREDQLNETYVYGFPAKISSDRFDQCSLDYKTCDKKICLCVKSASPYYVDEMFSDLKKFVLNIMEAQYRKTFDISLEDFKQICTNIKNHDKNASAYSELMNQVIRAILQNTTKSTALAYILNPLRTPAAMPGRSRPKPLNPFFFKLLSVNNKRETYNENKQEDYKKASDWYAQQLKNIGVQIENGDELSERCAAYQQTNNKTFNKIPSKYGWIELESSRGPIR